MKQIRWKDNFLKNVQNSSSKKFLKGSYTVEAAIVFSLTFFVLASLLIAVFYLHDCAVAQSAACEAAVAGSNFAKAKDRTEAAEAVKNQVGGGRFLGSRNVTSSTASGTKEVSAVWQGVYPVPGLAAKYLSGNRFTIRKTWKSQVLDAAEMIRKIKGIGDLVIGGSE
jgi:hypothetical protein